MGAFLNLLKQSLISRVVLALAIGAAPAAALSRSPEVSRVAAPTDAAERADALLARMTRDEKLQLVHGYFPPMAARTPGAPVADMIPSAGHIPGIPRLGVPTLRESDASLGVANQVEQRKGDVATALPGWRIAPGDYRITVARDAAEPGLSATATLSGSTIEP